MAVVYGIDTGSYKLRIATMEGTFGRFALRDVQEVVPSLGEDGRVVHAEALRAFGASEPAWAQAHHVAAWPADLGVVRLVRLPFADKAAIARALPAEVEAQVPYDLEAMVLATRVIEAREGASRTLAFIAPREELRERLDQLAAAGSDPKVLPFEQEVLATYADRGNQVVLDVGHRRTLVALCQGGQLVGARVLATGGAAITAALSAAAGVEWAVAEELKHRAAVPARPGEVAAEWDADRTDTAIRIDIPAALPPAAEAALVEAVGEWAVDVRAELISLEDEVGVGVDEVLVCGGGSRLRGLGELLASHLGVPVRPVALPGGSPPEAALALALARVAAGDLRVTDMRGEEFAYHGTAETLWNFVAYTTLTRRPRSWPAWCSSGSASPTPTGVWPTSSRRSRPRRRRRSRTSRPTSWPSRAWRSRCSRSRSPRPRPGWRRWGPRPPGCRPPSSCCGSSPTACRLRGRRASTSAS